MCGRLLTCSASTCPELFTSDVRRFSTAWHKSPSTVDINPFCVPSGISKSSSGIRTVALSDLITCRFRSSAVFTVSVCRDPRSWIMPPCWMSCERNPQVSHVNAMMITSRKYGTVVRMMFVVPHLPQCTQRQSSIFCSPAAAASPPATMLPIELYSAAPSAAGAVVLSSAAFVSVEEDMARCGSIGGDGVLVCRVGCR